MTPKPITYGEWEARKLPIRPGNREKLLVSDIQHLRVKQDDKAWPLPYNLPENFVTWISVQRHRLTLYIESNANDPLDYLRGRHHGAIDAYNRILNGEWKKEKADALGD